MIWLKGKLLFATINILYINIYAINFQFEIGKCYRPVSALFIYVSLDEKKNVQNVPQLVLQTDEERKRFKDGQLRYERRKEERGRTVAFKRTKLES